MSMRLRRVTEHIKQQNWFAIGIDFIIVVVGVLLAFQITAWNERRLEFDRLDGQLVAAQVEMRENLDRLATVSATLNTQGEQLAALRAMLAEPSAQVSESELNPLIWNAVPVYSLNLRRGALEILQSSAIFTRTATPALIDQIERWEEVLSDANRAQNDCLNSRDNLLNPYIIENLPVGSILRTAPGAADYIAPSHFSIDPSALGREFDGLLVARQICFLQDKASIETLSGFTHRIIELISEERKRL